MRRNPRRPFDDGELKALLDAAEALDVERRARMAAAATIEHGTKSKMWNERERPLYIPAAPFLRTLASTGARFAELAATTWADWTEKLRTLPLRAKRRSQNGRAASRFWRRLSRIYGRSARSTAKATAGRRSRTNRSSSRRPACRSRPRTRT